MNAYETRRRRIFTTGGVLTALAVYLLLAFTAFSGRDFAAGAEGAYASAGDPGAIALSALGEALRAGPGTPPAPEPVAGLAGMPSTTTPALEPVAGDVRALRTPVEDQQVLTL
ncbi:MAG: hypothetical protein QNJ98_07550 [Planctomycetota bacterium]|nr:hypothetical protein [Planctomycetota bacterium]